MNTLDEIKKNHKANTLATIAERRYLLRQLSTAQTENAKLREIKKLALKVTHCWHLPDADAFDFDIARLIEALKE